MVSNIFFSMVVALAAASRVSAHIGRVLFQVSGVSADADIHIASLVGQEHVGLQ